MDGSDKIYKSVILKSTPYIVDEYNKKSTSKIEPETVHAALATVYYCSGRSDLMVVESDILSGSTNSEMRFAGLCIQAVGLSRMGFPNTSRKVYEEIKKERGKNNNQIQNEIELKDKLTMMFLIAAGIGHGDKELAMIGADGLGVICKLDYPKNLVGLVVELKSGNIVNATTELNALNSSPQFAKHKQLLLAETKLAIEDVRDKKINSDDAANNVIRAFIKSMYDDIMNEKEQQGISEMMKCLSDSADEQSNKSELK